MNNKIYKYEIEIKDFQKINMPFASKILSVKEQNGKLCLWALVFADNSEEEQEIAIVGTGNTMDFDIREYYFIDTVVMSYGLVWHVFYK